MQLNLDQLRIERVAVMHVPMTGANRAVAVPTGGEVIVQLAPEATDMVARRLTKVLGHNSHAVEAGVTDTDSGSYFDTATRAMETQDDEAFLAGARHLAVALAKAQVSHSLPPCKLIVINGTVNAEARPYLAVIKAELQEALAEKTAKEGAQVDYLSNIFMTAAQRLYKVGFLMLNVPAKKGSRSAKLTASDYSVYVFDHLVTSVETRSAAIYFYAGFLGCEIASSAKALTRLFFVESTSYFKSGVFSDDRKVELIEALRSDLRSTSAAINVGDFATRHLVVAERPGYKRHMAQRKFPTTDVSKDNEFVKHKLRRPHNYMFSSGVKISAPADSGKLVRIGSTVDGVTTVEIDGILRDES